MLNVVRTRKFAKYNTAVLSTNQQTHSHDFAFSDRHCNLGTDLILEQWGMVKNISGVEPKMIDCYGPLRTLAVAR